MASEEFVMELICSWRTHLFQTTGWAENFHTGGTVTFGQLQKKKGISGQISGFWRLSSFLHSSWGATGKCQVDTPTLPFEPALWPGQGSPQAVREVTLAVNLLSIATQMRKGRADTEHVERDAGTLLCPIFSHRAPQARLFWDSWISQDFLRTELYLSLHHLGWWGPQDNSGPTFCRSQPQCWIQTILSSSSITKRAAKKWGKLKKK